MGLYFNLSEEEREFARQRTMFCLIIYDIRSNKRRLKLSKLLEGYGVRVQKSCFEVDLSRNDYQSLLKDIESFYKADEEDSIIVYVTTKEEVTSFSPYHSAEKIDDMLFFLSLYRPAIIWCNIDSVSSRSYILCL